MSREPTLMVAIDSAHISLGNGRGEFVYRGETYRSDDERVRRVPSMFLPATSSSDEVNDARGKLFRLAAEQNLRDAERIQATEAKRVADVRAASAKRVADVQAAEAQRMARQNGR
jgi:hypothetical protein